MHTDAEVLPIVLPKYLLHVSVLFAHHSGFMVDRWVHAFVCVLFDFACLSCGDCGVFA